MKLKNKLPLLLWGLVSLPFSGLARQDDPIKKAVLQLSNWALNDPQEKVHLHTDKQWYAAGENIWFKAYVILADRHQLSGMSKILYAELIDERGKTCQSVKLPVYAGVAWGDFLLPPTLSPGNYRIRSYTSYMRNAGPEYFFDKNLVIGSMAKAAEGIAVPAVKPVSGGALADKIAGGLSIQFFPEGGSLVNNIRSKIAFKAVGTNGLGAEINGTIKDNHDNEITSFTTTHAGMGFFLLMPESGKSYKAEITAADGSHVTLPLPMATDHGYTLAISSSNPEKLILKIGVSNDLVKPGSSGEISVIGQQNGQIFYAAKSKADAPSFATEIPKSNFPSGIVQFTLFSPEGEPLNERLVFIQNPDQLTLGIRTAAPTIAPRQQMKLDLEARDGTGQPVMGTFSVSVTDEAKVQPDEISEPTIFSNLLLTSDLKGYVERPNYYFTGISDQTRAGLDLLMMTQGYRRFVWKKLLAEDPKPGLFQPERSISISGVLKGRGGKELLPHGKITLMATQGGMFVIDTVTDAEGKYSFPNLLFADSMKFVVQGRTAKNQKNVEVEVTSPLPQPVTPNKNLPDTRVNGAPDLSGYVENANKQFSEETKYGVNNRGNLLQEVKIKTTNAPKPVVEFSGNLNGAGAADQVLSLADKDWVQGCPVLIQCLSGRLTGVKFVNGQAYMAGGLMRLDNPGGPGSGQSLPVPMLVIIDGMQSSSPADDLNRLNSLDVGTIEVLRSAGFTSIYGSQGAGGVIIITTRYGTEKDFNDLRNAEEEQRTNGASVITYTAHGYSRVREFYSPQYDDPKTNAKIADLRSTIFWKPDLVTSKDGTTSFGYFNADAKGTYRVVIEGIAANGSLGRQVYTYKVE